MKYFEQKQIIIGIACIVAIVLVIGYYFYKNVYHTEEEITISENGNTIEEKEQEKEVEIPEEQIIVHIAGEVKTPGIIKTKEGARIADIIEKAGGLKEEADLTDINLAYPVEDGQKITIPKKGQQTEEIISESSGIPKEENHNESTKNTTQTININKATKEELQTLQGIRRSHRRKNH